MDKVKINNLKKAIVKGAKDFISSIENKRSLSESDKLSDKDIEAIKEKTNEIVKKLLKQVDDLIANGDISSLETILSNTDNSIIGPAINKLFTNLFIKGRYKSFIKTSNTKRKSKTTDSSSNVKNIKDIELFEDFLDEHFDQPNVRTLLEAVYKLIMNAKGSKEEKEAFIKLISDSKNLIQAKDINKKDVSGNIDNLINNNIVSSPIYPQIKSPLLNAKLGSSVGKGRCELFLMVFGANSGFPNRAGQGDLIIDGLSVEVKETQTSGEGGTAVINSGIDVNKLGSKLNDLNRKILSTDLKITDNDIFSMNSKTDRAKGKKVKTKGIKMDFSNPIIRSAFIKVGNNKGISILKNYFTQLYTTKDKEYSSLSSKEILDLSTSIYNILSSKTTDPKTIDIKVSKTVGDYIFKLYKENKEFDILICIDVNGNFRATNSNFQLPKNMYVHKYIPFASSQSDNATPAGVVGLGHGVKS
jgi:hypothetical protein